MFDASDTAWAPLFVGHSDNRRRARLNIIAAPKSAYTYKAVPEKY